MNKLGYQPMPVILRAELGEARQTSKSANILQVVAMLGGIFALCGVVAFCLVAINSFQSRTVESKAAGTPPLTATQVYAAVPVRHENGLDAPPADANQEQHDTIADDRAAIDQTPTPGQNASSAPAPKTQASTSFNDNELLKRDNPESARTISEKPMSEVMRKRLERQRQRAERQRAELEESYRDHAISGEAYKKGEAKYLSAIEKYRSEMNAGRGSKNEATGQN